MKTKFYILTTFILLFSMQCKKEELNQQLGKIKFSFSNSIVTGLKSTGSSPSYIIVTVENTQGAKEYSLERIEIFNFNGYYISKQISLNPGNYNLTRFAVVNSDGTVIYAAPLKSSTEASLVSNPLSISFNVQKDIVNSIALDVISVADALPADFGLTTFTFGVTDLSNGLIAYYPFNGNVNDESGNGNNGTSKGATLTTDRFGNVNSAYHFDGISGYININNNSSIIKTNEFTISAWAKMSGPGGGQASQACIFEQRCDDASTSATSTIVLMTENENDYTDFIARGSINTNGNYNDVTATPPSYGSWHHYLAKIGSDKIMHLYIDGVEVGSTTYSEAGNFFTSITHVDIGAHIYGGIVKGLFNGDLDDIRIYNRSVSDDEVKALYNENIDPYKGLVAYYPFDGNADDLSGNNNDGTDFGPSQYVAGIKGNCRNFASNESASIFDFVTIPNTINPTEFSVCFWAKLLATGTHQSFLYLSTGDQWVNSNLWLFSSMDKVASIFNGLDLRTIDYSHTALINGQFNSSYLNSYSLQANQNYFIVCTFKNQTLTFYVNNQKYAEYLNVNTNVGTPNANIILGVCPKQGTGSYFYSYKGTMDELRIYNRAITDAEINYLYLKY